MGRKLEYPKAFFCKYCGKQLMRASLNDNRWTVAPFGAKRSLWCDKNGGAYHEVRV